MTEPMIIAKVIYRRSLQIIAEAQALNLLGLSANMRDAWLRTAKDVDKKADEIIKLANAMKSDAASIRKEVA